MNRLIISDLQIPFEHPSALAFCKKIQIEYNVPKNGVIFAGDEVDNYFGGMYKKDPNAYHSPGGELEESLEKLLQWYDAFPVASIMESNHGNRWKRKATDAEIPEFMMKRYQDVIKAPARWRWHSKLVVEDKYPFMVEHGDEHGGATPHIMAAAHNGMSTAIGHHHAVSGVEYTKTHSSFRWAMAVGSLIDYTKYAFKYGWSHKRKPILSVGVVVDGGAKAFVEVLRT